jgi:hypothetical protein
MTIAMYDLTLMVAHFRCEQITNGSAKEGALQCNRATPNWL